MSSINYMFCLMSFVIKKQGIFHSPLIFFVRRSYVAIFRLWTIEITSSNASGSILSSNSWALSPSSVKHSGNLFFTKSITLPNSLSSRCLSFSYSFCLSWYVGASFSSSSNRFAWEGFFYSGLWVSADPENYKKNGLLPGIVIGMFGR